MCGPRRIKIWSLNINRAALTFRNLVNLQRRQGTTPQKIKKKPRRVISYSTPTGASILKLHATVEMQGGVHRSPYRVVYVSSDEAAINVKFICVLMHASNKGRTLLLITDRSWEMSYCTAAAVFGCDRREEKRCHS